MRIRGNRGVNLFTFKIQFEQIELKSNTFYEVTFGYLINPNGCQDVKFTTYLYDFESLQEKIFDSTVDQTILDTTKWTFSRRCFQVLEDEYAIFVEAKNECDDAKVFIAFDELRVREMDISEDTSECLDWRVTMEPTLEITTEKDELTTLNYESSFLFDSTSSSNCKQTFIKFQVIFKNSLINHF